MPNITTKKFGLLYPESRVHALQKNHVHMETMIYDDSKCLPLQLYMYFHHHPEQSAIHKGFEI